MRLYFPILDWLILVICLGRDKNMSKVSKKTYQKFAWNERLDTLISQAYMELMSNLQRAPSAAEIRNWLRRYAKEQVLNVRAVPTVKEIAERIIGTDRHTYVENVLERHRYAVEPIFMQVLSRAYSGDKDAARTIIDLYMAKAQAPKDQANAKIEPPKFGSEFVPS